MGTGQVLGSMQLRTGPLAASSGLATLVPGDWGEGNAPSAS